MDNRARSIALRSAVATQIGARAERLTGVRALKSVKGRRDRNRFAFEGATLLEEAHRSGTTIEELYVTQAAYDATPRVRALDAGGTPTFVLDDRGAAKLSDVETPSGILAVASTRLLTIGELLGAGDGVLLVLGDLNDPGNAGTLLRSADAFGARGVVFGRLGVDPYHPKVVRGAMGALFRLRLGVAEPPDLAAAAADGFTILGLRAGGEPLDGFVWPARSAVVIGHERGGLGRWDGACDRHVGIPMARPADSLNAAIAGSIALYEAAKGRAL
ncbi:MAG: RNA methyltransferase [Candidatus Tumulicola sp.]